MVRDEIIKSNLQNNQSKNIEEQNEDKSKNKGIKNEEGITDDGNIIRGRYNGGDNLVPNMGYNNKLIKNIDNNGSMCQNLENQSNFRLLKSKNNLNNNQSISKISSINNVNKEEINLNKEENNLIDMNSNIQPVKENKHIFSKKANNEYNINKNNNPFTRNNNNNLKNIHQFFPSLESEKQAMNNNINNNFQLFGNANDKALNLNFNLINNNQSHNFNFIIDNNDPNYFTLGSNHNNDDDNLKNNSEKLVSMKKPNSKSKKYTNNHSDLNNLDLESYKVKIESEVQKLHGWMDEGLYSYHNANTDNLKIHVDNLRKELSTCDKFIDYYKKNNKNDEKASIAENLKESILKLILRYDEFIKSNSELKVPRSSSNKNK